MSGLVSGRLLTTGSEHDPLLPKLVHAINHAQRIDICVSFVQPSGIQLLLEPLTDALEAGAQIRILVSDYLYITHPRALRILYQLFMRGAQVKLFCCEPNHAFHLKSYIFVQTNDVGTLTAGTAFVGSSNLSKSALTSGLEWNLRFDLEPQNRVSTDEFAHIQQSFLALFERTNAQTLSLSLIQDYEQRFEKVVKQQAPLIELLGSHDEPAPEAFTPNEAQLEALQALASSCEQGYQRGLVVMATGMGKTWFAAFAARQLEAKRILFVAHREEILTQAERTFRSLFPTANIGVFNGQNQNTDCDFIFGSIQTIGKLSHLTQFARDYFDYIVVDEFHHATAPSYQNLLNHFDPRFLLGLTATPERTDQADILSLCDHNLIYSRDLVDGIQQKLLVPFRYVGILDKDVDYKEIPWRHGRFDPNALDAAFATRKRTEHIYQHWLQHKQTRTLAFCVSQKHADFMADYFARKGVRSVAVHAQSNTRRNEAIQQLAAGVLEVVFSVDLFNEGTDIPAVDTILMCRPTESKIVFLQQLGRGLRQSPNTEKRDVVVIDFIGNHASFFMKPAALFGTKGLAGTLSKAQQDATLPEGCHVNIAPEVIEMWQQMVATMPVDVQGNYQDLALSLGYRPSAQQFYLAGYLPAKAQTKIRQQYGSWFQFVAAQEQDEALLAMLAEHAKFLFDAVEKTAMTKCFKAILLSAFVALGGVRQGHVGDKQLAVESGKRLAHFPDALAADLSNDIKSMSFDSSEWLAYWRKNPIEAYISSNKGQAAPWFVLKNGKFALNFAVSPAHIETLEQAILELVDLRMAQYINRHRE